VSLSGIPELEGISGGGGSPLRIGARTLVADVAAHPEVQAHYPAVADGAGIIGSVQTRNLATIGGNVCNAAPSADTSPALAVHEATVHTMSASGGRTIPIIEFWTGPGRTVLDAGEVVTHLELPVPPARSGSHYQRHTPRKVMDIAAVGTAVYLELDANGACATARVALGAVAPTVIRAPRTEAALAGQAITEDTAAAAAKIAATEATPISDQRASAEFRTYLIEVMTKQSILEAARRAST